MALAGIAGWWAGTRARCRHDHASGARLGGVADGLWRNGNLRLVATLSSTLREIWSIPLTNTAPDLNGRTGTLLVDASHQPFWTFTSRDARTVLYSGWTKYLLLACLVSL